MHSLRYAILNTLNTVVRNVGVILIIYFNNSCFILMCQRFLHFLIVKHLVAIYDNIMLECDMPDQALLHLLQELSLQS